MADLKNKIKKGLSEIIETVNNGLKSIDNKLEETEPTLLSKLDSKYWKHYRGGIYEFVTLAQYEGMTEPIIVYRSILFGTHKAQPLSRFLGLTENGTKRFVKTDTIL